MLAPFSYLAIFSSCQKENSATTDSEPVIETTFKLAADNSTSGFMLEANNDVLMEAASEQNLLGNFASQEPETNNLLACATVSVTPGTGFPKTIVILFDSTCVGRDGSGRNGLVRIGISDSFRRSGSSAVMTVENHFVNRFKRDGTHTITNTSQPGSKSWQRKVEAGKITGLGGRYWLHEYIKNTNQTAGVATQRL